MLRLPAYDPIFAVVNELEADGLHLVFVPLVMPDDKE